MQDETSKNQDKIRYSGSREEENYGDNMENIGSYLKICGDIDHHTCEMLRQQVDQALESTNSRSILFSFAQVSFMDSSGIGVLIGRYKLVQRLGGRIAVACPSDRVREIFRLSALDKLFPFFETEEAALADLKGGNQK